jgi:signal transduction histidine kinase
MTLRLFFLLLTLLVFSVSRAVSEDTIRLSSYYSDSMATTVISEPLRSQDHVWLIADIIIDSSDYPHFIEVGTWNEVSVYHQNKLMGRTGKMVPLIDKIYPSHRNLLPINHSGRYLIKINPTQIVETGSNSQDIILLSYQTFSISQRNRLIGQSIFFGLILIMSLYNLMIYFSVKDRSYLYYVLSIAGIGLYLFSFYGFSIEFFWPASTNWDAHFFALIIPLTNITRILFTKSYLDTKSYLPRWHGFLNFLTLVYLIPLLLWSLSYFGAYHTLDHANSIIGLLGTTVMTSITIVSILVYRQGYRPALWFLMAYILFNIGGVLFIFRELGYISDNFFTRYLIQYGVGAQVILFSLGLASRLNEVRNRLTEEIIQKEKLKSNQEKEKQKIIERQKIELEKKVKERTKELEHLIVKISQSESELKELNHLKDKLFAIISHDLKSPLTTVDSFLNLMINHHDKLSQEELTQLSNKTKFALQNLTLLLDNLLQWSRVQQDYVSFNPTTVDLSDLYDKNRKLFRFLLEDKDIHMTFESSGRASQVWADKDMLDFILRNLIHNAIKFSVRSSSIAIKVFKKADHACIEIQDQGRGMSDKEIRQIMIHGERFTTIGTEKEKGTGIGLLMCKDFVERLGGNFEIRNGNQGLCVSFSCPLAGQLV